MALAWDFLFDALSTDQFVWNRLIVVDGWERRTRNYGQNTAIKYITCHHTASSTKATPESELAVILKGNSVAPGPISQLFISRRTATRGPRVYLVAAGTCNHRGAGTDEDGGTGNARALGIEVSNNGIGERWDDEQVELYARVVACVLRWKKWPLDRVHGHWNYAPSRKVDPKGPAAWNGEQNIKWPLAGWRNHVGLYVMAAPVPEPIPTPEPLPDPDPDPDPDPTPVPVPEPPITPSEDLPMAGFMLYRLRGWHDTVAVDGSVVFNPGSPPEAQVLVDSLSVIDQSGKITPAGTNFQNVTRVVESRGVYQKITQGHNPGTPNDAEANRRQ